MQRKAIILSAGQGRRLSPLTDTRPKCLIELSGFSVLQWQLRNLAAAGVQEAVVVTGFGADAVRADIAAFPVSGLSVRTLFNPFYAVSDNLATCWMIRQEMDGGFLLLNGDTLFEPAIAQRLLNAPAAPITLAVDRKATYDADDMKVRSDGPVLLEIGKTIEVYDAESIGFLRFSPEGAAAFSQAVDAALQRPEGLKRWYLSVIDQLAHETGKVTIQSIEGLGWAEMDFHEDIPRNLELTEQWTAALQVAV